ncbi:hypothetical protein GCM10017667_47110 [Streptomyces filamentosus]|uniref:Uncharacterized protein n=2 Tax=Streptomyces filamentosus TaxID=67294 RepID=A0A919EPN4_STRFL|nr:hypothetical protein GCM10017667_47110 [Streptomyces filamentosus]
MPEREDTRLSLWRRVRAHAVPPSMIETATARRLAGDWAGACAAAGVDLDLAPRTLARTHGADLAARVRADLRRLAPDLLRWHLPRTAPDGLLRPGLTVTLAVYDDLGDGAGESGAGADGARPGPRPVHLVARTAPAWADAGQRISLALWHGPPGGAARSGDWGGGAVGGSGGRGGGGGGVSRWNAYDPAASAHPHPHPSRRFRFDLHRHLWDATRAGELRTRSGADRLPVVLPVLPELPGLPPGPGWAVDRWAAEARLLLAADGGAGGAGGTDGSHGAGRAGRAGETDGSGGAGEAAGSVTVRLGARHRLLLTLDPDGGARTRLVPPGRGRTRGGGGPPAYAPADRRDAGPPLLPDAATWTPPDLALLRAGLIAPGDLHPLVAAALVPGHRPGPDARPARERAGADRAWFVECRGNRHRIGLVDGVLAALDHDPAELRREELLVALSGTPLPCLRVIDEAHRRPDCLDGVRERLAHGDAAGALAVVEALLGPAAALRDGPLREALERAAERKVLHGLYRAGLRATGPGDVPEPPSPSPSTPTPASVSGAGTRSVPAPGRPRPSRSRRFAARAARRRLAHRAHPRHALPS